MYQVNYFSRTSRSRGQHNTSHVKKNYNLCTKCIGNEKCSKNIPMIFFGIQLHQNNCIPLTKIKIMSKQHQRSAGEMYRCRCIIPYSSHLLKYIQYYITFEVCILFIQHLYKGHCVAPLITPIYLLFDLLKYHLRDFSM